MFRCIFAALISALVVTDGVFVVPDPLDVSDSCTCGEPCVDPTTGSSGTCGEDSVTCANFVIPPNCAVVDPAPFPDYYSYSWYSYYGGYWIYDWWYSYSYDWYSYSYSYDWYSYGWYWYSYGWYSYWYDSYYGGWYYSYSYDDVGTVPATWCPDSTPVSPTCRLAFCPTDQCDGSTQCAMRLGDCTCDYTCADIGATTVAPSLSCSQTECVGSTCTDYSDKGIDPSKVFGCTQCDTCGSDEPCTWWSCEDDDLMHIM